MRTDYAEVFQSDEAVDKYERVVYAPETYSTAVSGRQRAFLRRLVRREFTARRPVQHDFACGTGRAIKLLHGVVRAAHGYDVSAQMLAKAQEAGVYAKLHQVDGEGPVPEPATVDGPALVTVFRLLLNAPKDVRDRAIAFAAKILPEAESGLLVVENHGNRSSPIDVRLRLNMPKKEDGKAPMSVVVEHDGELYSLLVDAVGEVLSLNMKDYQRNPPTLNARLREFSDGIYRLNGSLLVVLSVGSLLNFGGHKDAA